MIYKFYAGRKGAHIRLDNKKTAEHNETMDLDEEDLKRPLIKKLIHDSQNKSSKVDKLIKVEEPEIKENGNNN